MKWRTGSIGASRRFAPWWLALVAACGSGAGSVAEDAGAGGMDAGAAEHLPAGDVPGAGPAPPDAAAPVLDAPAGAPDAAAAALCPRPGLGAVPYEGGTMFRVWAPHAQRVLVTGDFNGWSQTQDELRAEGNAHFVGCVAGARPGQAYKLVLHNGDKVLVRGDPRARRVTNSAGNSLIVDPRYPFQARFQPPPFNEQVIYEMHVGTYNDEPGGRPGTFRSVQEKLDHLSALGVNMIELLPPAEFGGDFSWGYNPAYPFAPESAYGTPDDFKALVDAAHARGIGVIVDVVHNHWGPSDLPMWCWAGECLGAGGVYFYTDWRHESGWGPRPDYGRRAVRDYIRDNVLAWLEEYQVDGLRWDSTVSIRSQGGRDIPDGWSLMQEINDLIDQRFPRAIQIAEDLQRNEWVTRPTRGGGAGFDTQWDAGFVHPIHAALIAVNDGERSMAAVRDAIGGRYNGNPFQRVVYTESHDEVANGKKRLPEMIDRGQPASVYARKRSMLGAALVMTVPGIPMLFQGQEFLEDGWFRDTVPLDWSKTTRFAGVLAYYRDLVSLRRNLKGHSRGLLGPHVNVFHVNDRDKVVAFHRWQNGGPGDDVVVVASFASRAFASYRIGLPRGGAWKVRLNGDARVYGADFAGTESLDVQAAAGARDGLAFQGDVGLGPYAVVVLSQ